MQTVAIIGAGVSSLMCARELAHEFDITLFEKARGVSGRMATRRVPEHDIAFDHGAQYFTIRSQPIEQHLQKWLSAGIVAPWDGKVVVLRPNELPEVEPTSRYVAVPAMNALGKHLAESLDIRLNTRIESAQHSSSGWVLTSTDGQKFGPFDVLVCTAPPEQTNAILGATSPFRGTLVDQQFDPCWATLVHFPSRIDVDFDAAFVHENPLRWICRNNSKPGRNAEHECWVLHASGSWSRENLECQPEEITPRLLEAFAKATGANLPEPIYAASHRWRYSAPVEPLDRSYLWDPTVRLGICGDWCSGARVEGALFSGHSLAAQLLE
ncbi:NAD(P)/FAD-dependent oxidoreductase [Bremerella cremea]|uniref:NAD(P)/FAD-dependent oxidoreductase n=1 Tax=Bremerella cremea TaxID=1031537 RepID=UPI0031E74B2A